MAFAKAPGLRDILLAVERRLHEELPYSKPVAQTVISATPLQPLDPESFSLISFRPPAAPPTIPLSHQEPGDTNDFANALLVRTQPVSVSVPPPPPSFPVSVPPPLPPPSAPSPYYTLPERSDDEPNGINSVLIKLSRWGDTTSLDALRQSGELEKMFEDQDASVYPVFEALLRAQANEIIARLTGVERPEYQLVAGQLDYSNSCAAAFVQALYDGSALFPTPSDDVARRWLASGVRDYSEQPSMPAVLERVCTAELFLSDRFDKVVPNWPWVVGAKTNPRDEIPRKGVKNPSSAEWEAALAGYTREGVRFRPANAVVAFFARLVFNRQLSDIARVVYDGQPGRTRLPMNLFSVDDLIAYLQKLVAVYERWTPVFPLPKPSAAPGTTWKLVMAERMEKGFFAAIEGAMPEINRPRDGLMGTIRWRRGQTASEFALALRAVLRDHQYCDSSPTEIIKVKKRKKQQEQQQQEVVGTPMERFLRQSIFALGGDPDARKEDIARIAKMVENEDEVRRVLMENAGDTKIHANLYLMTPCPLVERMNRDELAALPLPAPGSLGIYEDVRHLLFPYAVGTAADKEFLSRSFDWTNTIALEHGWWHIFLQEVSEHAKTAHICSLDSLGRPLAVYVEMDHPLREDTDNTKAYAAILQDVIALNGRHTLKENMALLKPSKHATARWGPHDWLHQVDGRTECTAEKPWMPVVVSQHASRGEGHRTLLLINRFTGIAYYFEPNGDSGDEAWLAFVVPTVRTFLVNQGVIDAEKDMRRVVVLDRPGPQVQQNRHGNLVLENNAGTCVIWSQLFFHLFIINPQFPPEQIIEAMLKKEQLPQLGMVVSRYAMWLAESSEKNINATRNKQ
ncbi:hypothetical protein QKT49_gp433 [Acanthamoeba castellanii medusavirus]|uniref:Uncharacterized protein n=1 Tax=Acanthamoeba castellanii medusavirus J1 TaxID=3114988 RepID=A0A3T1CWW8_9VIRU|nr:hypothetical protein QKT49_gp433 [Acanthamoeba castellanii medusavirus]BBI30330.1 hypothetical protein [Acanthamoeba castellanii medusavirus J1]